MDSERDVLFMHYQMGQFLLKNRIVMPPMTRSRAGEGNVATGMMAAYYSQRASAGLIISEGTPISPQGHGYAWTPGIYTDEQIEGWRKVTSAVHQNDGCIFAQLWHVGRVSHTSLQPAGEAPVSASAIKANDVQVFIDSEGTGAAADKKSRVEASTPRELSVSEIKEIELQYRQAAENAIDAGFDGVEIHAANGYLISQFINSGTNIRTDEYGGSLENRLRFLKEVTTAVCHQIGANRVGVRLTPFALFNDSKDDNPESTYIAAAKVLQDLDIVYLHISESDKEDGIQTPESFHKELRRTFKNTLIYAGNYNKEKAIRAIEKGWCDLVGFGRDFIANPDLPFKMENDIALNKPDIHTFYGGIDKGYLDYPFASRKPI